MLGAPTQRWMFIQQSSVLVLSSQWCEIPAGEPARQYHEWELHGLLYFIGAQFGDLQIDRRRLTSFIVMRVVKYDRTHQTHFQFGRFVSCLCFVKEPNDVHAPFRCLIDTEFGGTMDASERSQ